MISHERLSAYSLFAFSFLLLLLPMSSSQIMATSLVKLHLSLEAALVQAPIFGTGSGMAPRPAAV